MSLPRYFQVKLIDDFLDSAKETLDDPVLLGIYLVMMGQT